MLTPLGCADETSGACDGQVCHHACLWARDVLCV